MMKQLSQNGFDIVENVYTFEEIEQILTILKEKAVEKAFGVREFLITNLELLPVIFNIKLRKIIKDISPKAKLIRSLYFDKPPHANWIVNWHQDLTINLKNKVEAPYFKNWRVLPSRTVVQPPLAILENIFTIRVHLDNCRKSNGALQVVPKSHQKGIIQIKTELKKHLSEIQTCEVEKGGVLLMKPLLLHASRRSENEQNRRVIHMEFSDSPLPPPMKWKEAINLKGF